MKLAVLGAGGVGGYFGGRLARSGEDVWFIARGAHLEAMRRSGLRIDSFESGWVVPPGKMTDNAATVGTVDAVLFCVKSYDTESAARSLEPLLAHHTIIISLQNGIDNEEKIQRLIPRGIVFGGVAYIYANITTPGVITHTVGPTKIVFGPLAETGEEYLQRARLILEAMHRSSIDAELVNNIDIERWKKYIFIAAVGGMTALTRLTLGEILAVPEARALLADAMRETLAIAHARGIGLPHDFVDYIFEVLNRYDTNSRSSLYHDLVHGRRLEIEAFSGTIVSEGRRLGIPTPVHRAIYAALLPYHLKHSRIP